MQDEVVQVSKILVDPNFRKMGSCKTWLMGCTAARSRKKENWNAMIAVVAAQLVAC